MMFLLKKYLLNFYLCLIGTFWVGFFFFHLFFKKRVVGSLNPLNFSTAFSYIQFLFFVLVFFFFFYNFFVSWNFLFSSPKHPVFETWKEKISKIFSFLFWNPLYFFHENIYIKIPFIGDVSMRMAQSLRRLLQGLGSLYISTFVLDIFPRILLAFLFFWNIIIKDQYFFFFFSFLFIQIWLFLFRLILFLLQEWARINLEDMKRLLEVHEERGNLFFSLQRNCDHLLPHFSAMCEDWLLFFITFKNTESTVYIRDQFFAPYVIFFTSLIYCFGWLKIILISCSIFLSLSFFLVPLILIIFISLMLISLFRYFKS